MLHLPFHLHWHYTNLTPNSHASSLSSTNTTMAETRYFENTKSPLYKVPDPRNELIHSLNLIIQSTPPQKPWTYTPFKGLLMGPTSIAYLFLWLSKTHPELLISGRNGVGWCERYLDCGSGEVGLVRKEEGFRMGFKNEYIAYRAVKAALLQDLSLVKEAVGGVRKLHVETEFEGEMELFDGRAGTLLLSRIMRYWVPESRKVVNEVMGVLIEQILEKRPWVWRGGEYVGAAHGLAGIVTQVVLCDPGSAKRMEGAMEELLDQQNEDGSWFVKMGQKSDKGTYVQWCHGSPGVVVSLMALREHFPDLKDKLETAIEKGRKNIWEKGLLVKEPNLCHGISGNMLCFDKAEEREHLMSFAAYDRVQSGIKDGSVIGATQLTEGLLFGEPGRAWAWMVVDSGKTLGFPAYTSEV